MLTRKLSLAALLLLVCALSLGLARPASAGTAPSSPSVYSFEGFSDGDLLTTQYPGLIFSNTVIATAGVSLDELEALPHSRVNVAEDSIGPITIDFASPVAGFGGYFNYAVPLTLTAFNAGGQEIGVVSSAFSSNFALSGDPGSNPNEFLQIFAPVGLSRVTIAGAPDGDSFTLDDATVTPLAAVPEVSSLVSTSLLLFLGFTGIAVSRRRSARRV